MENEPLVLGKRNSPETDTRGKNSLGNRSHSTFSTWVGHLPNNWKGRGPLSKTPNKRRETFPSNFRPHGSCLRPVPPSATSRPSYFKLACFPPSNSHTTRYSQFRENTQAEQQPSPSNCLYAIHGNHLQCSSSQDRNRPIGQSVSKTYTGNVEKSRQPTLKLRPTGQRRSRHFAVLTTSCTLRVSKWLRPCWTDPSERPQGMLFEHFPFSLNSPPIRLTRSKHLTQTSTSA